VNIDFIGDIHANYNKLKNLLELLGYVYNENLNIYTHPENRKLCILGDFINVGLQNEQVLDIIYNMHIKNQIYVIAGNHEYFLYSLFKKTETNKALFWSFLQKNYFTIYQEFYNKKDKLYNYINWIGNLPIFFEFGNVKVVHAFWDNEIINSLKSLNSVSILLEMSLNDVSFKENINKILIGIIHKYHQENSKLIFFRYRWWDFDKNLPLENMFIHKCYKIPKSEVEKVDINSLKVNVDSFVIFFGHYNLQGYPHLTHPLRCCLDFGGAKGGFLTAYRWNGEEFLSESNLLWV
jgi:hypothetical protein